MLVRDHEAGLRRYLRRLAPDEADDLAQESLLVAWRSCGQWRGDARFATWLRSIATRRFLDERRRSRRQPQPEAHLVPASSDETRIQVDLALASLPPRERAAALLVFAEGQSHSEAAAALGMPLGTLKSIVARARDKLIISLEGVSS